MRDKVIISTREQLLFYVAEHCPYKFLVRALQEGEAENLGAFNIRGGEGWIVRVRAMVTKQDHYIAVTVRARKYEAAVSGVAPGWKYWVGDISEHELYRGDNPDKYAVLREKEINDGKN